MRILFFLLYFCIGNKSFSQDSISIAPGTDDLNRYTIFLKGEFHNHKADNEHSFRLLAQYLYTHNNVRYLVFEWGPDFIYLANRYLQTQNDLILFKNNLFFSKAFWDTLVSHNRYKPSNEKIKIAGFDFNRSVFTARAFREMMKGKPVLNNSSIRSVIEKVIHWEIVPWTWDGQNEFVEQMKALRFLCKDRNSFLEAYFGEDWPSFFAIINHDVESMPMVKRDKKAIGYVKEFLAKKGEGNVLFNLGVAHTFLNGGGIGNFLQRDEKYRDKVCSIYPYHNIPNPEKEKGQQVQDENLPSQFLAELQTTAPYSLINMVQRGIYPKTYKKTQWVYVIPKVKQP